MSKVTVDSFDLYRVLHNASLFAADEALGGAMSCVEIAADAGLLKVRATDNYQCMLDAAKIADREPMAWAPVLVRASDLRGVISELKRSGFGILRFAMVTVAEGAVTIQCQVGAGLEHTILTAAPYTIPSFAGVWPVEGAKKSATQTVALDPAKLAVYAKVVSRRPVKRKRGQDPEPVVPMRCEIFGAKRPVEIRVGETFLSLIMPVIMPVRM